MNAQKPVVRKIVAISKLIDAAYNPPNRCAPDRTRDLENSMEVLGLLSPILCTEDYLIIDGHRRLAVAKRLKWKEIECNIINEAPEGVYASVNTTARRMSGNDALGVWLKEPLAVTHTASKAFAKMTDEIGRKLAEQIYKDGCSVRVYRTAKHIAKYCDQPDKVAEITAWLLDFATIGHVMKALDAGVDSKKIMKAVVNKQPITLRLDVA